MVRSESIPKKPGSVKQAVVQTASILREVVNKTREQRAVPKQPRGGRAVVTDLNKKKQQRLTCGCVRTPGHVTIPRARRTILGGTKPRHSRTADTRRVTRKCRVLCIAAGEGGHGCVAGIRELETGTSLIFRPGLGPQRPNGARGETGSVAAEERGFFLLCSGALLCRTFPVLFRESCELSRDDAAANGTRKKGKPVLGGYFKQLPLGLFLQQLETD